MLAAHSLVRLIRTRRTILGKRPRVRKRLPRQTPPVAIEVEYAKAILSYRQLALDLLRQRFFPILDQLLAERADEEREDAGKRTKDTIDGIRSAMRAVPTSRITEIAQKAANETSAYQKKQLQRQIRSGVGVDVLQADAKIASHLEMFVHQNVALIQSIPEEMLYRVEQAVQTGIRQNWRAGELGQHLEEQVDVSESKARFIARDQVSKLFGEVNHLRQGALGITEYIWRTMQDERVRPSHADKEGERYSWDDPPDDTGHPGEDFQCVPGDTRISFNSPVIKAFRRWHSGELTQLITDSGEPLDVTGNHPVLTTRGWLPAHLVQVGDNLIDTTPESRDVLVDDPERCDATAQEVFCSLAAHGVRQRIAGRASWFHGDGSNEEINVVYVNRRLFLERVAARIERFRKDILAFAATPALRLRQLAFRLVGLWTTPVGVVGGARPCLALSSAGLSHAQQHRFGSAAGRDSFLKQALTNDGPRNTELFSQDLLARAPGILPSQVVHVDVHAPKSGSQDAPTAEQLSHALVAAAKHARDLEMIPSIEVCGHRFIFREVTLAHQVPYQGWVYNFETTSGWYTADNRAVKNCRCYAEPILDDIIAQSEEE